MPSPSSSESEQRRELEQLQVALATRLVHPEQSSECFDFDPKELDRATETLIRKRLSQTRSLLSESVKCIGKDYRRLFREYSRTHHFDGHRAILLDAVHFADWMLARVNNQTDPDAKKLVDSLRWEQELCRLRLSRFRVRLIRNSQGRYLMVRVGKFLRIWKL
ncbi:MAG: hypothetical protein ACKN9S_16630 [Pirellula sp.]